MRYPVPVVGASCTTTDAAERSADLDIRVADLSGTQLGYVDGRTGTVYLDLDAAGHAWFIDTTPLDDWEYRPAAGELRARVGSDAYGRIDLLTAVGHEIGHLLGLDHDEDSLMATTLDTGERYRAEVPAEALAFSTVQGRFEALYPVSTAERVRRSSISLPSTRRRSVSATVPRRLRRCLCREPRGSSIGAAS